MRGTEHLHPELQGVVNRLITECNRQGLPILITETYRTKQEQDDLYAKGRTNPGGIVTNVRYPHSMHCWGVAFDFCKNVKGQEYSDGQFFDRVGKIGQALGLTWGGSWTGFVDRPHFQLDRYGNTKQLIAKYGSPDGFKKTWKGGRVVDNVKINVNGKIIEVRAINHENQNYISLRDLEKAGFTVSYDKMPVLKTK
jgi:peptidoglycan L-alanyl-D-glutamate endopeptidase CwlK